MIHYLVTADHSYTIDWLLFTWRPDFEPRVTILPYERLSTVEQFSPGTYIFSDLERLDEAGHREAADAWNRIVADGNLALNDPNRVLDRYNLLRELHAGGESRFQIYRVRETRTPERFPVFLRPNFTHEICSGLLYNQEELDTALEEATRAGHAYDDLLMVEYLHTPDREGIFRKYGAYLVGERLIPAWISISLDWATRAGRLAPELNMLELNESWKYVRTNPHDEWIRRMFQLASIDYGRIDYGLIDGEPQLWEINTNPTLLYQRDLTGEEWVPFSEYFADTFVDAMNVIDRHSATSILRP